MKFIIFFIFATFGATLLSVNGQGTLGKCLGDNEEWRFSGPSEKCDPQVCRDFKPNCFGDEKEFIDGCFCKLGYFRYGGKCIEDCPYLKF